MGKHDGAEHFVFRKLLGFGFDHHHGIMRAGDDEIEATFGNLGLGRVEDIFAVVEADASRSDRAHERHAGQAKRSRSGDHGDHIGFVFAVIAQHLGNDVDFVVETFGEQRAQRAVDEARSQRLVLGGAAFALEEATRDAAGSGVFFLVMNGQREEILAFLDALGSRDGAQNDSFTISSEHGAIGLTGDAAGFKGQRAAAPFDFLFVDREHVASFVSARRPYCRRACLHVRQLRRAGPGDHRRRPINERPRSRGLSGYLAWVTCAARASR